MSLKLARLLSPTLRNPRPTGTLFRSFSSAARASAINGQQTFETSSSASTESAQSTSEKPSEKSSKSDTEEMIQEKRYSALFGDPEEKQLMDTMLRVDHAGEFGAVRIYEGQYAVLRASSAGQLIKEMGDHEREHLKKFNRLLPEYRVRPTALLPLWSIAGYALGAGTALLGKEAAMCCTDAVEDVISEHYNDQIRTLSDPAYAHEGKLRQVLKEFRDDELRHQNIALEHDAQKSPLYNVLTPIIKAGCRAAIWISTRV